MSRYIDVDALLNAINQNIAEAHNERCAQLLEAILHAPTADVVEVKHGEWKKCYDGFHDMLEIVCSSCGRTGATHFQYCPHCGAKMGGERRAEEWE